jgi:SAM-dependent methyltransferase
VSSSAIRESAGLSLEIQQRLSSVDHYNCWIFDRLAPYAGRRILDVGCAIGNITSHFLDRELVVGIDVVREFVEAVRERFANRTNFRAELADIAGSGVLALRSESFDTVVCTNVLEHVRDDRRGLEHMHTLLVPGGRLLLFVPAFPALWGTLDEADHHYRRYGRSELRTKLVDAGFRVERLAFTNPLGIVGWVLNGKVLKRQVVSAGQLRLYDRLVPALSRLERVVRPPLGLSLVAVAVKNSDTTPDL